MCVRVHVCVHVHVCLRVCACACVCMRALALHCSACDLLTCVGVSQKLR